MDAELKAKWVKALRSRKFKQARQLLHDESFGGYCCLGVLCVVAEIEIDSNAYKSLSNIVGNWGPLVFMNDDEGKSFEAIASYIEKSL